MEKKSAVPGVSEFGLSLIELMIAMGLALIMIVIIGSIYLSTMRTQLSVSGGTDATVTGELVISSIGQGIRNSQVSSNADVMASTLTPTFRIATASSGDQLLVALVAGADSNYSEQCSAWYYSSSERSIRSTTSASAIKFPTEVERGNWTLLASGVAPANDGSLVFAAVSNTAAPASLDLTFTVESPRKQPVRFDTVVTSRTGLFRSEKSCY